MAARLNSDRMNGRRRRPREVDDDIDLDDPQEERAMERGHSRMVRRVLCDTVFVLFLVCLY